MCGDLGYTTYCGDSTEPAYFDFEPPDDPRVHGATAKANGVVSIWTSAERGSTIEVSDSIGGRSYYRVRATGSRQVIQFRVPTGNYVFDLSATDAAGNTSYGPVNVRVAADASDPKLLGLRVDEATARNSSTRVTFSTEPNLKYRLAVGGRTVSRGVTSGTNNVMLALRNSTQSVALILTDDAGNSTLERRTVVTNVSRLRVGVAAPSPTDPLATFRVTATPKSKGTIQVAGQRPVPFKVGADGHADVEVDFPDGEYAQAVVRVVDFAGRKGTVRTGAIVLDRTSPTLVASAAEGAAAGQVSLLVQSEPGTRIAVDTDEAENGTWAATGGSQVVRLPASPGLHAVTVTATDSRGNVTLKALAVTAPGSMQTGTTGISAGVVAAVAGCVILVGVLVRRAFRASRQRD